METLTAKTNDVLRAYKDYGQDVKQTLEALFGREVFLRPITDRIQTFQDALNYKGETLEQFNKRTEYDSDHERAYKELCVIAFALNEGKHMDYQNTSVKKYYPYFTAAGSGSGFAYIGYGYGSAYSVVGARLCVDTAEKAEYLGRQFISIYNRYIN